MRRGLPDDADLIASLENEIFLDESFNELTLRRAIEQGICWVEEKEGQLVAYILCLLDGPLLDIVRLGVRSPFEGQGIASRLLYKMLREYPDVMLCVRKKNHRALLLYLYVGFQVVGELESSWVMRRLSHHLRDELVPSGTSVARGPVRSLSG